MFEFWTCNVISPCWMGEDADGNRCDVAAAWHFDKGEIDGVDISGLTLGAMAHIPGNILDGGWRVSVVVDENASAQQEEAILSAYTGKQDGPVADIVKLIGDVVSVERAPIIFEGDQGQGILKMGDAVDAEMVPYLNSKGEHTILQKSVFSAPARRRRTWARRRST